MNLSDFPGCCGSNILWGFGINNDEKTFIKTVKDSLCYARGGIVFGITNLEQIREGKLLAKCGFKKIKTFPNPNTGLSELTLWGYDRTNLSQKFLSKLTASFIRFGYFVNRVIERRNRRAIRG